MSALDDLKNITAEAVTDRLRLHPAGNVYNAPPIVGEDSLRGRVPDHVIIAARKGKTMQQRAAIMAASLLPDHVANVHHLGLKARSVKEAVTAANFIMQAATRMPGNARIISNYEVFEKLIQSAATHVSPEEWPKFIEAMRRTFNESGASV